MSRVLSCLAAGLCLVGAAPAAEPAGSARPNVLFIAIDDLNHWVGHLQRNPQTRTPNLDRLAARGVTFTHAYCTAPACNPSRASLMASLRPSSTGIYHNSDDWRPHIRTEQTLNDYFRKAGYHVVGAGKIYHGSFPREGDWHAYFHPRGKGEAADGGVGGIRFAPLRGGDEVVPDYAITDHIIAALGQKHDRPFFLACGLHKPHMPWNVPRKYYDMFPLEQIQLPPHTDNDLADVPPTGKRMARPEGDHAAMLKSGRWKEAVQAYLAAIAYTDMNVGRLLDALDRSTYKDNTVVVLWGDHGWHLGEKEHWRKFALWEEATRAPLVWVMPGVTRPGGVCTRTVDFLSIYPTLCDLCGLPTPKHVEGVSIRSLLADPKASWDRPALTTHGQGNHAVRTEQWRYIRYADGSEELYDEVKDPYEWTNLAGKPELAAVKKALARHLPQTEKKGQTTRRGNKNAER